MGVSLFLAFNVMHTASSIIGHDPVSTVRDGLRAIMAELIQGELSDQDDQLPLIEMGANSLTLMEFSRAVEKRYAVKIPIRAYFEEQLSLETLALRIHASAAQSPTPAAMPDAAPISISDAEAGHPPVESPRVSVPTAAPAGLDAFLARQLQVVSDSLSGIVSRQLDFLNLAGLKSALPAASAAHSDRATDATVPRETSASPAPALPPWRRADTATGGRSGPQQQFLDRFVAGYNARTPTSKRLAQEYRAVLADNRASAGFRFSTKEMLYPIVGVGARGSRFRDMDDNEYIDITMGFGVNLFGHQPDFLMDALRGQLDEGIQIGPQTKLAGEVAGMIRDLTGVERVAFCNTGTEAVMTALRLARAVSGRDKVVMFEGAYHGHYDGTLGVDDPDRAVPGSVPAVPGVLPGMVDAIVKLEYGTDAALDFIRAHGTELAAVIVEPIQSRRPGFQPGNFLRALAKECRRSGTALIFDEMISGFRIHPGGARAWFDVDADLVLYGKIIGGGLPIGIVAGRAQYLDALDGGQWQYGDNSYPSVDTTFFAGTFNKHPLALAAASAVLRKLRQAGPDLQAQLNARTDAFARRLNDVFQSRGAPIRLENGGSQFRFDFSGNLDLLFYLLPYRGVYVWEGRNCFLSTAHSDDDLDEIVDVVRQAVDDLHDHGFIRSGQSASPPAAASAPKADATSAVAVDGPKRIPLTSAQRQLLLAAEISRAGSQAYHVAGALRLSGPIDIDALRQAVATVIRRHDALRTVIEPDGRCQRIDPPDHGQPLDCPEIPITESSLTDWLTEETGRPFDLVNGPLFRTAIGRLAEDRVVVAITAHHIVVDGWSMGVIIRDLGRAYAAACAGDNPEKSPDPTRMTFSDYVAWRNASVASNELREHADYWLTTFDTIPPALDLPADRPASAQPDYQAAREVMTVPSDLESLLPALARRHQCTPFVIMLAAYQLLLHRLTQQPELVVGVPVAGRPPDDAADLVGYCTHMLPVRGRLDDAASLTDFIRAVRGHWLDAYSHQDYPFAELLDRLRDRPSATPRQGAPGAAPLFSTTFNMDRPIQAPSIPGHRVEWISPPIQAAPFELFFNVIELDQGAVIECDYRSERFTAASIRRILKAYINVLRTLGDDPEAKAGQISLLDDDDRKRILHEWNATAAPIPDDLTLSRAFERQAVRTPDTVAVTASDGSLTYADLNRAADRLAAQLIEQGIQSDMPVGLQVDRSTDMLVGMLGILKAGGAYLPIDLANPPERTRYMLADAGARVWVTQVDQRLTIQTVPTAGTHRSAASSRLSDRQAPEPSGVGTHGGQGDATISTTSSLAYVIYTSGSTGLPKGVMIEHAQVINLVHGLRSHIFGRYPAGRRIALVAPYSFDASVQQIFSALLGGHSLFIVPESARTDGRALLRFYREHAIELSDGTPTHLRLMLDSQVEAFDFVLRHLVIGGEPLPTRTVRDFFQRCTDRSIVITNVYGPTECCVDTTAFDVTAERLPPTDTAPIGRPLANQRVYVVDPNGRPVPENVAGELLIGGAGVGRGYLNGDAQISARFLPAATFPDLPESPDARLYRTGDWVHWTGDGDLVFRRRNDRQVKIRGHRIEIGEIEKTLLAYSPTVESLSPGDEAAEHPRGADVPARSRQERPTATGSSGWPAADQTCTRCVLTNRFPGLTFDAQGVCRSCRDFEAQHDRYMAWFQPLSALPSALGAPVGRGGEASSSPDCMLLYSGGKDSSYVLYRLVDMGYNVLTFTFDNGYISDTAFENIRRITRALDVENVVVTSPRMRDIFRESLNRDSTVCTGCFKALTLLSTKLAADRNIPAVVTGLSRGQIMETKLEGLLQSGMDDPDAQLDLFRRMYHAQNDRMTRLLDVAFEDAVFDRIRFIDFFRYDDTTVTGIKRFLEQRDAYWTRPDDTGFCSTNCLVNDVGIYCHTRERGYHNYAAPLSWQCRLNLMGREEALEEVQCLPSPARVHDILTELGVQANDDHGTGIGPSPVIREAVVIDRPDPSGVNTLYAYYVADRDIPGRALRDHLADHLPTYMTPSAFIRIAGIPLTASGKLNRLALPAPDGAAAGATGVAVERSPAEILLADIWMEVLGRTTIDNHDNFFEIGGHSLSATRVMSRVNQLFSIDLPVRTLFEAHDFIEFKDRVEAARRGETAEPEDAPPAIQPHREASPPLSFAQQRLWFLDQYEERQTTYNIPGAVRLEGSLNVTALKQAVATIAQRHESLRTTFPADAGKPVQRIAATIEPDWKTIDLHHLAADQAAAEVEALSRADADQPFDLATGPLFRFTLIRVAPETHILLLTLHHIISDGWSLGVLIREMALAYPALCDNPDVRPALPPLPLQYRDIAQAQHDWLRGRGAERQRDYWVRQLVDAPAQLNLPADRPRPALQTFRGATHYTRLDADLAQRVLALSRDTGTTPFMILLGTLAVLLRRFSRQDDLVIGTPVANRTRPESEPLIGFFVNTLALRIKLDGNPDFMTLLERVRNVALDGFAHQDLPFDRLVDDLQIERDLSRTPVFQVMFILHNTPDMQMTLRGLRLSPMDRDTGTSKFDLTLAVRTDPDGAFCCEWEYNTDLFEAPTIDRLARHYQRLIEAVTDQPERPIAMLDAINGAEPAMIERFRQSAVSVPIEQIERTVPQRFADQARQTPRAAAIRFGDRTVSYAELRRTVNRLAVGLRDRGVKRGDTVAVCLERGPLLPAALLAIMKTGATYLPIDPDYPEDRQRFMVTDANAGLIVTDETTTERWRSLEKAPELTVLDITDEGAADRFKPVRVTVKPDDAAYIIYTSGSTGQPKGVEIPHRALNNFLASMAIEPGIGPTDRLLAVTTIAFDIAALEMFLPLVNGATLVIVSRETAADGHRLAEVIAGNEITLMQATPATWRLLFSAGWTGSSRLRVLCGGEALSRALADQLIEACGDVWNLYGPTETTIWSTLQHVQSTSDTAPASTQAVPIGRPIANTTLAIVEPTDPTRAVPVGVPGELVIGGIGVALGYRGRPALTAEKFIPDPDSDQADARRYRTGDLVRYRNDGVVEFMGRLDHQVKLRGFRIELGEIEVALERHPEVSAAVVLTDRNDGDASRLIGYVTPVAAPIDPLGTASAESVAPTSLKADEPVRQISQWRDIWHETYEATGPDGDPGFNITGWNDSVTGRPIPEAEMREWVDVTVQRIRGLKPRRILEVGCGTGLLLGRLAPECESYVGIDFAESAIDSLKRLIARQPSLAHVSLYQAAADQVAHVVKDPVDLVIFNSVIQYFPGVDYLLDCLRQAVDCLRPGGAVFIGDVRHLGWLAWHHLAIQSERVDPRRPARELRQRVELAVTQDEELALDPLFFRQLPVRLPNVTAASIRVKRGRFQNEMSRFRYDAVLHVGEAAHDAARDPADGAPVMVQPSDIASPTQTRADEILDIIRRRLADPSGDAWALRDIPNARLSSWSRLAMRLEQPDAQRTTVRQCLLNPPSNDPAAIDPETVYALAQSMGWEAEITVSGQGVPDGMDILFHRSGTPLWRDWTVSSDPEGDSRSSAVTANDPLRAQRHRRLAAGLRSYLRDRLPDIMIPSSVLVMPRFPMTANGKIDRASFPLPDSAAVGVEYVAPVSDTEKQLAGVWSEVLGIDGIGRGDNFFDRGGHSLLATQLIARIRDRFALVVPVRQVFEAPVLSDLAGRIDMLRSVQGRVETADPERVLTDDRESGEI